jgi:hypothetical protein
MFKELSKETIDRVFHCADLGLLREDEEPHQIHVLVELYKIAYPDWEKIASVDGWPTVTRKTNEYIFRKFIAFDDKHHNKRGEQGVFRGGLWMNNGFSTQEIHPDLQDWQIDPSTAIVHYEEGNDANDDAHNDMLHDHRQGS